MSTSEAAPVETASLDGLDYGFTGKPHEYDRGAKSFYDEVLA